MTTTPTIWKSSTKVNTTEAGTQVHGGLAALLDGGYVVVWTDDSNGVFNPTGDAVVAQRYDVLGQKVGGEVEIHASQSQTVTYNDRDPAVTALPNGNIAIAFAHDVIGNHHVIVEIRNSSFGLVRTDAIDLSTSIVNREPSITAFGDNSYVVAYKGTAGAISNNDIVARFVSATGTVSAPFAIADGTDVQSDPEVAKLSNGNFVTVWEDQFNGSSTDTDAFFRIMTPTGGQIIGPAAVTGSNNTAGEREPDVAALITGNRFVMVWTDDSTTQGDIRAAIVTNAGATIISNIVVNTTTAGEQNSPDVVALLDGGFVVTWDDGEAGRTRAQRFDANGNKVGVEASIKPGSGGNPEAALLRDGRIAYASNEASDVTTSIWDPRTSPINGTVGGDTITSRINGATVNGLGGNDVLHGMGGADMLDGGTGADTMTGRGGNDIYLVDNAGDKIVEAANEGVDIVYATTSYTLAAGVSVNILRAPNASDTTVIDLTGNALVQTLAGNAAKNKLDGGAGVDAMSGFAGNDTYVVDHASDTVNEIADGGTDVVLTTVSFTLGDNVENAIATGSAAINLTANKYKNSLVGNSAINTLIGGLSIDQLSGAGGDDIIVGGAHADTLIGGVGKDKFDFNGIVEIGNGAGARDVVTDFLPGTDRMDLSTIDANGAAAGNTAFSFLATKGAAFTGVAGQLRWLQENPAGTANDKTIVEGDVDGNSAADFQIELKDLKTLTVGDFIL